MDADGHSYHVPAKCHTYVPDHLAGDDDYREWAKGWGCWEKRKIDFSHLIAAGRGIITVARARTGTLFFVRPSFGQWE